MLVLGFKILFLEAPPKIKIEVNANRGSPTWKPLPNSDRDKWGSGWKVQGNFPNINRWSSGRLRQSRAYHQEHLDGTQWPIGPTHNHCKKLSWGNA
jgi:hypothetical protein